MDDAGARPEDLGERMDVDGRAWGTDEFVDWLADRMLDALDGFGEITLKVSGIREDARAAVGADSPIDWDGRWDRNYETMRICDAADAALNAIRLGVLAAEKILGVD